MSPYIRILSCPQTSATQRLQARTAPCILTAHMRTGHRQALPANADHRGHYVDQHMLPCSVSTRVPCISATLTSNMVPVRTQSSSSFGSALWQLAHHNRFYPLRSYKAVHVMLSTPRCRWLPLRHPSRTQVGGLVSYGSLSSSHGIMGEPVVTTAKYFHISK